MMEIAMSKFIADSEVPINKVCNGSNSVELNDTTEDINHNDIAGHTFLKEMTSLQKHNSFLKKDMLTVKAKFYKSLRI